MRPSDHVDADDPQVSAILTELVELVLAHGGRLDPDAVIVERDHELLLELRAEDTPERPVVRVPPELLVPVGELDWVGEDLTLAGPPDHLPPPAAAALELMLELYRTCGKVEGFAATSPRVAAAGDEALAVALAGTRLADATVITADARTAFLDSRVLSRRTVSEGDHGSVLMPLIDVMNHDPEGAEFLSGPPGIAVSCRRPLGDQQCFARYDVNRDPLDLAIHYGFATMRTNVANSAPAVVELPDGRRVRVSGQRPGPRQAPTVIAGEEELVVSHLSFQRQRPNRARAELTMPVGAWVLSAGGTSTEAGELGHAVWDGAVRANLAALNHLEQVAVAHGGPVSQLLGSAVNLQRGIILDCAG